MTRIDNSMILDNPFAKNDGTDPSWLNRFVTKIDIRGEDECWEWQGSQTNCAKDGKGYGSFRVGKRGQRANRIAWVLANGEIPSETPWVLHKCDNRSCCNPFHLFLGTYLDNIKDMQSKGRHSGGGAKGEQHGMAILSETEATEINRLFIEDGLTMVQIAMIKGVAVTTISNIIRGNTWTCLERSEIEKRPIIRAKKALAGEASRLWVASESDLHPRDEIGKRAIKIRDYLLSSPGKYFTSTQIGKVVSSDRITVGKMLRYLKSGGWSIEIKQGAGYRLIK